MKLVVSGWVWIVGGWVRILYRCRGLGGGEYTQDGFCRVHFLFKNYNYTTIYNSFQILWEEDIDPRKVDISFGMFSFKQQKTSKQIFQKMGNKTCDIDRNVLIVADPFSKHIRKFMTEQYNSLPQNSKCHLFSLTKYEEGQTIVISQSHSQILDKIDLVVVIGQNKDLFKAFSLFVSRHSPPIFGLGYTKDYTSPLLYNYECQHAQLITPLVFNQPRWNNLKTDNLMKMSLAIDCKKVGEATSQIQIHRGMNQAVVILNIYIQNSCEKQTIKIGQFKGDGLIISTPLGSFGKSMSFHGPLMCRTMENITITPICPLSMKFRPLCLPAETTMFLELDKTSRSESVDVYMDEGSRQAVLKKGEFMRIRMSKYKSKIISNLIETSQQFFIRSLQSSLRWGESYQNINISKEKVVRRLSTLISVQDIESIESQTE